MGRANRRSLFVIGPKVRSFVIGTVCNETFTYSIEKAGGDPASMG